MDARTWSTAIDCAPVPVAVGSRDGVAVAVICDPSGAWADDLSAADGVPARLVEALLTRPGPLDVPTLEDLIRSRDVAAGNEWDLHAALIVARVAGARMDLVSAGTCAGLILRGRAIVARSPRQTLGERLVAEGEVTSAEAAALPVAHVAMSAAVFAPNGAIRLESPLHRTWTLRSGDTVLVASKRLAERLERADGPRVEALIHGGFSQDLVCRLPDRDPPTLWTERQFAAAVMRVGAHANVASVVDGRHAADPKPRRTGSLLPCAFHEGVGTPCRDVDTIPFMD